MTVLDDLVAAVDRLREAVAYEVRSRNKVVLAALGIVVVVVLINTALVIVALRQASGANEAREVAANRTRCANTVQADAESAAYHEVDLITAASLIRQADALPPDDRAKLTLPPAPSIADLAQARNRVADVVRRLNAIGEICYTDNAPDDTPLDR